MNLRGEWLLFQGASGEGVVVQVILHQIKKVLALNQRDIDWISFVLRNM